MGPTRPREPSRPRAPSLLPCPPAVVRPRILPTLRGPRSMTPPEKKAFALTWYAPKIGDGVTVESTDRTVSNEDSSGGYWEWMGLEKMEQNIGAKKAKQCFDGGWLGWAGPPDRLHITARARDICTPTRSHSQNNQPSQTE